MANHKKNQENPMPSKEEKMPSVMPPGIAAVPEWMKGKAGEGVELIRAEDVEIPRIKLIQALSPEATEGASPGAFWHTIMLEHLGPSLEVVPVYVDLRYILWRPRKAGGGILARSWDGATWEPDRGEFTVTLDNGRTAVWRLAPRVAQSGLAEWGSSDPSDPQSPPAATRMYNVVVMLPHRPDLSPAVVTFQRSSVKVARRFIAQLKISSAPSYGMRFRMYAEKERNRQNQEYFNFRMASLGLVEDERSYRAYQQVYQNFKNNRFTIKGGEEGLQHEAEEAGEAQETPF